ncbi:hypothetical protein D3H55_23575 [Bacillus salacetis]|uniref:DUF4362 domain-containing protein n=1 Tax=Bacillus salacetis TaxID=2315464 RepID=A0A3A1QKT7_9BACI|nr:hypothetical protein [Bacillus salacetis]RIW26569.1 hypothetical protein D3H55_23575 [Bacillus salacetis]
MRAFITMLLISMIVIQGCSPKDEEIQGLIEYEYISQNEGLTAEVSQWLNDSKNSKDAGIHSLSTGDGVTYVYAKGYKKAKAAYIYQVIEGKVYHNMKVTLLTGKERDTTFIKIKYESDTCCDTEIFDETDSEKEFYDAPE